MEEKKIVEMTMEDLRKIVGGQGENESGGQGSSQSGLCCPECGNTEHFHIWRNSPMDWSYYVECLDCGWTKYFQSNQNGR